MGLAKKGGERRALGYAHFCILGYRDYQSLFLVLVGSA